MEGIKDNMFQKAECGQRTWTPVMSSALLGYCSSALAEHEQRSQNTEISWNLYSYVLNNPMNYTDPYGLLREGEGGGILSSTSDSPDSVLKCSMMGAGCEYKFGKCICGGCEVDLNTNVYNCGFGESVSILGASVGGTITEEDIKKYLPDEFFEEFNLIPFEVWAAQYSMHGGPWVFAPNYKDPAVQIMGQVSQNVQPWLDYGEDYLMSSLSLFPLAPTGSITVGIYRYKRASGFGLNLLNISGRSANKGLRILGIDYHKFKLSGKIVKRFHLDSEWLGLKHWPWK